MKTKNLSAEAVKKNKINYISQYNKDHMIVYTFRASIANDSDIINKLDSVPNKAGYIKTLIRQDIAKK